MTRKVIKDTKYCQILNQGKVGDKEYTYCIEKIFIKAMRREEEKVLGLIKSRYLKNLIRYLVNLKIAH